MAEAHYNEANAPMGSPDFAPKAIADHEFRFTAARGLYATSREASALDARDQVNARMSQLCAMLDLVIGEGFPRFAQMDDATQENYLWSCTMAARECKELLDLI